MLRRSSSSGVYAFVLGLAIVGACATGTETDEPTGATTSGTGGSTSATANGGSTASSTSAMGGTTATQQASAVSNSSAQAVSNSAVSSSDTGALAASVGTGGPNCTTDLDCSGTEDCCFGGVLCVAPPPMRLGCTP